MSYLDTACNYFYNSIRIWCIGIKNGNIYGYSIKMIIENPILDI